MATLEIWSIYSDGIHSYKLKINEGLEQETPFAQIRKKKTKRLSPYGENEIWELDELQTIIKYESQKRNKAALALMWDLSGRNHEITLLKLRHIRLREKYGEGEIPHQSKPGSGPFYFLVRFRILQIGLTNIPSGTRYSFLSLVFSINNLKLLIWPVVSLSLEGTLMKLYYLTYTKLYSPKILDKISK